MVFVKVPTREAAEALANGLYRLSQPASVSSGNVTKYVSEPEIRGAHYVIPINPSDILPIHPAVVEQFNDPDDALGSQEEFRALASGLTPSAQVDELFELIRSGLPLLMSDLLDFIKPEYLEEG